VGLDGGRVRRVRYKGAWVSTMAAIAILLGTGTVTLPDGSTPTPTPTPTVTVTPTPTPGAGDANLWVNTTAGASPTRCSTACPYSSTAAYGSFAAAAAAASSGDVIRVKAGTYGRQGSLGSAGKSLTFIGEDGTTVDSGTPSGGGAYSTFNLSGGVTVDNVDVTGDYPIVQLFGHDNEWRNSSFTGRLTRRCDSDEPIVIQNGSANGSYTITNARLVNIDVGVFRASVAGQGGCPSNDPFHLELIRIGRGVDGVLIDRSRFADCGGGTNDAGCGSGQVFITDCCGSGAAPPRNITIRNSVFEGSPNFGIQVSSTLGSTNMGLTLAYNTWANNPLSMDSSPTGITMVGNAGPRIQICTSGVTFSKNVWQHSVGTPCGTDTLVIGTSFGIDALALEEDFRPQPGSPLIDAAQADCSLTATGVDIEGRSRPVGSACDAGAYEEG
jgi:hypothetical protein